MSGPVLPYDGSYFTAGAPANIPKMFSNINYLAAFLAGKNLDTNSLLTDGVEMAIDGHKDGMTGASTACVYFRTGANTTVVAKSLTLMVDGSAGAGTSYTVTRYLEYWTGSSWGVIASGATITALDDTPVTATIAGTPLLNKDAICRIRCTVDFGAATATLHMSLLTSMKLAAV